MKIGQEGSRFVHGATGVAATSILTWLMFMESCDDEQEPGDLPLPLGRRWSSNSASSRTDSTGTGITHHFNHFVSNLTSFSKTSLDAPSLGHDQVPALSQYSTTNKKVSAEYDFVVVGHGNAGKHAVETLQQECPGATIALVDPLRPPVGQKEASNTSKKLCYYNRPALGFHPPTRTIELPGDSGSGTTQLLRYRHAILVATGSRGAPPPMELLDRRIWNRVLELRPTEIFGNTHDRPVLPPETIRQLSLMASSQGAKVCVLGSGWEALELVVAASVRSKERSSFPMLAFGSAGPLSHLLPRYLSTAVTKRLRQQGIDIHERALVRYVSHHAAAATSAAAANKGIGSSRMEVHTAKSFDLLDTQRKLVDLLVVAPYVDGPRGTAVLPMLNVPESVDESSMGRTWYQSWSQLSSPPAEPSTVVCYVDDGRVSVNAELSAASKVYAAGSVAKYPNSVSGHAHVAGEGSVDGALAGRLAALHMARDYHERTRSSMLLRKGTVDIEPASFASKSFPIFRSDISPYNPEEGHQSSLSKVGIKALVVGHCDSEKMSTHGFWWTNMANKRHNTTADASTLRRKRTKSSSNGSPIYGSGVVFYLDGTGRIRGVMSWGLPITADDASVDAGTTEDLNPKLVSRMIEIIKTNGGIAREGRDQKDPLLNAGHLSEESRHLAQVALSSGTDSNDNNNRRRRLTAKINRMGKPLHRYTAAKPPNVTSIGLLKRKDQSVFSELLGENIYIKDDDTYDERPPSLLYIYPMHSPSAWRGSSFGSGEDEEWKNPYLLSKEDRMDAAWKENQRRARPSKEEPLWLRRGDALRSVSMQDMMNDVFLSNMRSGRFADGSEPFQRAKVPMAVQEASEKLRSLVGGVGSTVSEESSNDEDDEQQDHDDDREYE